MKLFKCNAGATRSRAIATPTIGLLLLVVAGFALAFAGSARSAQATINLGNADSFGALSATAMTNAGSATVVNGNIGSSTSIDAGVTHPGYAAYGAGTPELAAAQASLLTAYGFAEAQTPTGDITGVNLANKSLAPGVYNSTSGILISGPIALTLDGGGDPNSVFIFQAASSGDLTVDPTSSVTYTNGAQPCNVFWKVNSAFLKNSGSTFVGTIMALTQITLTDNITVQGRVLARNADVTFIHDTIVKPTCAAPVVTTAATTAATTTAATTTAATTTTSATSTSAVTTTTPAGSTSPGATTTTPAGTTSPGATTTTAPNNSPAVVAAAAKAAKAADAKARKPSVGHAKPPRHRFGLTG